MDTPDTPALAWPTLPRNQRVVFEHQTGPYKGLHQIMGHTDDFPDGHPPTHTDPFPAIPDGRIVQGGLVSSHTRFLLYREIVAPRIPGNFVDRSTQR